MGRLPESRLPLLSGYQGESIGGHDGAGKGRATEPGAPRPGALTRRAWPMPRGQGSQCGPEPHADDLAPPDTARSRR